MNPLAAARYALRGRVVTMDKANTVLPNGTIYVDSGGIVAVQLTGTPAPAAFNNVQPVDTQGTIYPGLIELHNHLSYNALPLWSVPRPFNNRDQWTAIQEYHQLVTGPMNVLGKTPGYVEAIVRMSNAAACWAESLPARASRSPAMKASSGTTAAWFAMSNRPATPACQKPPLISWMSKPKTLASSSPGSIAVLVCSCTSAKEPTRRRISTFKRSTWPTGPGQSPSLWPEFIVWH